MKKSIIISFLATVALWAQADYGAPGTLKWRYQTGHVVRSSPAIGSDGTIYVGSWDNYIYALTPSGQLKWRYQTGGIVFSSPAIGSDGTVYVGSDDHYLYALIPSGQLKWRYQTGGNVFSSPAIGSDGTVYVGSYDDYLYALTPSGQLKWRYQTGGEVRFSPAIYSDGTVYVGSNDNYLYAVNADGSLKWRYQTGDNVCSCPAIGSDGTVYVGSMDDYLYVINPSGRLKWRYQTGYAVFSSPAIGSDGTVYVGSWDNYLYALTPSGQLKWRYQTGGNVFSSPAIGSDGTVYVGSMDDYLYVINPSGRLKWRYETGNDVFSSPAIYSDGTVYVGSCDDYLYAIRSDSRGLASSAWPKFHHDNQNTGSVGGEVIAAKPSTPLAPPELAFTVKTTDTDADGIFEGGETVSLTVSVTNSGKGKAEEVAIDLSGADALLSRIGKSQRISRIDPGETRSVTFSGFLPYDVQAQNVEARVTVSEPKLGKIPQEKVLQVAIAPAPTEVKREVISKIVDVDLVPSPRSPDPNAYGVVIGISKYREGNIPDIAYAENDAKIVAQYFSNVLGVPSHQLYTFYDDEATRSDFEDLLKRILPNATQGGKVLYFYYAGHGTPIPDSSGKGRAYLVPYNGQLGSQYKLYSLDSLYASLGDLPVENVVAFVDACFSGTGRSALAPGQRAAVMVEPETETWPANLRVITAAKGTETAWDYEDVKHGLFTYYLLDGLRGSGDTDGDGYLEFGELFDYIHTNVLTTSTKTLLKRQEPVVLPEGQKGRLRIVKVK